MLFLPAKRKILEGKFLNVKSFKLFKGQSRNHPLLKVNLAALDCCIIPVTQGSARCHQLPDKAGGENTVLKGAPVLAGLPALHTFRLTLTLLPLMFPLKLYSVTLPDTPDLGTSIFRF